MEFRHVRYFITVAEELNFTRAAERLHIAQPPLSRQIQQLEEEIGTSLFARDRRRVQLTPAGQLFLQEARKLVAQLEHALAVVRSETRDHVGIVRVGIAASLGEKLARALAAHEKRFPLVEIAGKDIWSTLQNRALLERTIDVGFLRPPVDRRLISEHLFYEPVRVLVARSNPLAKLKSVHVQQLAGETLLLPERHVSSGIYDKVLEIYRKTSPNPKIVHTQTGPYEEAGTMMVATGKGIFLVSGDGSHRAFSNQVRTVPLNDAGAAFEVRMAWRKGENAPAVLNFLKTIRQVFK
jgi:DNA-binding transcriptional LysR family regulator